MLRAAGETIGFGSCPPGMGFPADCKKVQDISVTSDGVVKVSGDVVFAGQLLAKHLTSRVIGVARHPKGGYWLCTSQGEVFGFGGAPYYGSRKRTS